MSTHSTEDLEKRTEADALLFDDLVGEKKASLMEAHMDPYAEASLWSKVQQVVVNVTRNLSSGRITPTISANIFHRSSVSGCRRTGRETSATPRSGDLYGTTRSIFNYPEHGRELRNTAWLDGLRGLAAFEVFVFHYLDGWLDKSLGWGVGRYRDPAWYRLPIIRTFYASGDTAVCVFFAISGYVLTHRMLSLIRRRRHEELYSTLSSAVFRRGIRLYMPVVVETFSLMILGRFFGLSKPSNWQPAPTLLLELKRWFMSIVHLLLPLRYPDRWDEVLNIYDGSISWTIPLEYYGSLVVYVAILLFSRTRSMQVRHSIIFGLVVSSFLKDDWIGAQFLMGMAFADYQLESSLRPLRQVEVIKPASLQRFRGPFFLTVFFFGFFLAGLPGAHYLDEKQKYQLWPRPFFDWISQPLAAIGLYATRQVDRYLECLAGMCLVIGLGETPSLKRITEARFVQYLGRISFGLYLCHIFVHAWLRPLDRHYLAFVGLNPAQPHQNRNESVRMFIAYCLMMIPSLVVNFIVAGLFERYVDQPSIKTAKLFEKWCLSQGTDVKDVEDTPRVPLRDDIAPRRDDIALD